MLTDMRRALGIVRNSDHPVSFIVDRNSTSIRVANSEASLACQLASVNGNNLEVALPMRAFSSVSNLATQELQIDRMGEDVTLVSCDAKGVRTTLTEKHLTPAAERTNSTQSEPPPAEPEWLVSNNSQLGRVLHQAARISDPESTRYSLGCIRLRGSDGQVAATDSRQAYAVSGFAFPVDEVLVAGAVISKLPCIANCSSISIGRADSWLAIRCAVGTQRWSIDLKIPDKGRFPNVDQCFPAVESARSELTVSEQDALYLLKHLRELLGTSKESNPVTLDLVHDRVQGKQIAQLRFRRHELGRIESNAPLIEITLDSSRVGPIPIPIPMRVAIDSHYLLNALKIGFRKIHLQSAGFPIFCMDGRSKFVWTALHESLTICPTPGMTTISTSRSVVAA